MSSYGLGNTLFLRMLEAQRASAMEEQRQKELKTAQAAQGAQVMSQGLRDLMASQQQTFNQRMRLAEMAGQAVGRGAEIPEELGEVQPSYRESFEVGKLVGGAPPPAGSGRSLEERKAWERWYTGELLKRHQGKSDIDLDEAEQIYGPGGPYDISRERQHGRILARTKAAAKFRDNLRREMKRFDLDLKSGPEAYDDFLRMIRDSVAKLDEYDNATLASINRITDAVIQAKEMQIPFQVFRQRHPQIRELIEMKMGGKGPASVLDLPGAPKDQSKSIQQRYQEQGAAPEAASEGQFGISRDDYMRR